MFPKETQDNLLRIAINLPEFHQIPKASHITNYSKAESTVRPPMLRYSTTQFVNVSLCCISLTWNSFIVAFFFLDGFSAMQQNKNVWIQKWPARWEFDRSKWLARREFYRSSPRSGRTLSIDRPLFSALNKIK